MFDLTFVIFFNVSGKIKWKVLKGSLINKMCIQYFLVLLVFVSYCFVSAWLG